MTIGAQTQTVKQLLDVIFQTNGSWNYNCLIFVYTYVLCYVWGKPKDLHKCTQSEIYPESIEILAGIW